MDIYFNHWNITKLMSKWTLLPEFSPQRQSKVILVFLCLNIENENFNSQAFVVVIKILFFFFLILPAGTLLQNTFFYGAKL